MAKKAAERAIHHRENGNDAERFRKIVDDFRSRIYHTAYGIVQDPDDAKDITQEVFLKIYEKMGTFKGEASFSTWIYRITVNACIDMLRKKKTGPQVSLREGIHYGARETGSPLIVGRPDSPFDATYQTELRAKIKEAFLKLSPEHRTALVLREIEGLSYQEIANSLECSVGTVMSRLHYARKRMQKLLAPVWGDSR